MAFYLPVHELILTAIRHNFDSASLYESEQNVRTIERSRLELLKGRGKRQGPPYKKVK